MKNHMGRAPATAGLITQMEAFYEGGFSQAGMDCFAKSSDALAVYDADVEDFFGQAGFEIGSQKRLGVFG